MRGRWLIASLALFVAGVVVPAQGADFAVVAGPQAAIANYATQVALYQKGGTLTFVNADAAAHNLVASDAFSKTHCPKKPGVCPKGTPAWCLPPKPKQPYTAGVGSKNPLPYAPLECPLFWTPLIGIAQTTPVRGVQNTAPDKQYTFICTIHPGMKGTLVVVG